MLQTFLNLLRKLKFAFCCILDKVPTFREMGFVRQYVGFLLHKCTHGHTFAFYLPGLLPECPQPAHTCHRLTHTHLAQIQTHVSTGTNTRFTAMATVKLTQFPWQQKWGCWLPVPRADTETCRQRNRAMREVERGR